MATEKEHLTIEYFFDATEDLTALLRENSTDGIIYVEKTMTEEREEKKEKNMLFVNITLIPVELLN